MIDRRRLLTHAPYLYSPFASWDFISGQMFQDDAGTTPAGLGDVVGLVHDASGNGRHLEQSTASSRPHRIFGGLNTNGVDEFLVSSANLDLSGTNEMSIVLGVSVDTTAANFPRIISSQSDGAGSFRLFHLQGTSEKINFQSEGASAVSGAQSAAAYSPPFSACISARASLATDTVEVWVDGVQSGTSTTAQGGGNFASTLLYVGRAWYNGDYAPCTISSLAVYDRYLTDLEMEQVGVSSCLMHGIRA